MNYISDTKKGLTAFCLLLTVIIMAIPTHLNNLSQPSTCQRVI